MFTIHMLYIATTLDNLTISSILGDCSSSLSWNLNFCLQSHWFGTESLERLISSLTLVHLSPLVLDMRA